MIFRYKIYMALLILASGCTSYLTYYETEPPRIRLKGDQTKMLFISRFDTSTFDFNQKKKIRVYKEGYQKYIENVIDGFDFFVVDIRWMESRDLDIPAKPETLARTDIQRLCKEHGASMLLVLEDFDMYRDQTVDVQENDDGSKSKTADFYVKVDIIMNLFDHEGGVIDKEPIYAERHLSSRSVISGLFSVGPALGNRGKEIYPMLTELGAAYVENFKPQNIPTTVKYYAKGELEPVKEMIKMGDLESARRFLIDVYDATSDPRIKSQAAHNIYVVYMALEDKEGAMEWQTRSYPDY